MLAERSFRLQCGEIHQRVEMTDTSFILAGGIGTLHMRRKTIQKGNRIRQQVQPSLFSLRPVSSDESDQVIDRCVFILMTHSEAFLHLTDLMHSDKAFTGLCIH